MRDVIQSVFDAPAYNSRQASHYIGVSYQTLRGWIGSEGLITTPQPNILSFNNLAEAHVLKAMRKVHQLSLQKIRKALRELAQIRTTDHPLLDESFETDGVSLCIRDDDQVINLSKNQQREFQEFVSIYLHRIQRDSKGMATHLYPFITKDDANEPQHISISPKVSFGRPVLVGTGISTSVIAGRFTARDSVADLAREYEVDPAILEDAIRWEMLKGKAA
jgi:uncharacterized protein (DUF433 family)